MDWDLYAKYGDYNKDGDFIIDHEKWHYYAERPELHEKMKRKACLYLLIPILGCVLYFKTYEEIGLDPV